MSQGKVWLVGAGPGDVGLFTLKGKEVLEKADVVVYDRLVGHGILALIPREVRCIDVGKRAGDHKMPQWRINQVLVEEAKKGNRVVRLKGGDPFLFGRGGEELELLRQEGIPYEVVCGVTSPLAVPAYNGIPVTHRDYCSSLHIVTGHKKEGEEYDIDFGALVRTKGTLVFLMGVRALPEIMTQLMRQGMSPDMPAAVLQKGTTARQKRIVATVSTLEAEAERQGVETPAIIVVGRVCALADQFAWYEYLPLAGMKVAVTRPRESASSMTSRLRERGAEVIELPTIRTQLRPDQSELKQALSRIEDYRWLVFTSPSGVRSFFTVMKEMNLDVRSLFGLKLAAVGAGTARTLGEYGLICDLKPGTYDGEALGEELAAACTGGEKILIPRAGAGGRELIEKLESRGDLTVEDIPVYDTVYERTQIADVTQDVENGDIDCVIFTSASTVRGFAQAVPGTDWSRITAACIGRQTAAEAAGLGMKIRIARKASMDSLAELVEEIAEEKRRERRQ